ncbi:keratin-associated protein 5-4-like [Gymnodraco acuticeps]|uniref:Keratin-associated protein 5-4-like n=1 Tax=Gymnodraco acuticeps TaxID=8218 RepID=A0A6P8UFQ6_GYMAC|nr:keratin-associated protein 5-4-like [Gymnodraco acuticeps]
MLWESQDSSSNCSVQSRPMGLKSCKPCNSCLQSKEDCRAADGCSCVCDHWRYCSEHCCDICCQMCVDVCSGLCSGDCSYTFCTLCLGMAQNCISFFTTQKTESSESQQAMMDPVQRAF